MEYEFKKARVKFLKEEHRDTYRNSTFQIKPNDITKNWDTVQTFDLYDEDEATRARRAYDIWMEFQEK